MDKIAKSLKKLLPKEKEKLKQLLEKINRGAFVNLDVVKLKGKHDIYRVRQGDLRIIFTRSDETIKILAVERRSDTTYSF